jgi:hypothetical protein
MSNKYGMAELRAATIEYLKAIPKNADTEPILNKILPLYQQNFRDKEFEELCKSIRNGTTPGSVKRPEPVKVTEVRQDPITEKKMTSEPVVETVDSKPEETVKDPTAEMAIMDLYTDGIEKAKAKYSKPSDLKKALKDLGIESKGSYEDLWAALTAKFNEINNI